MGKINLSKKIDGSIIEPIIAIVLLMLTMVMAFGIILRLNITPALKATNKANELIDTEVYDILVNRNYIDNEKKEGALTLTKTVVRDQTNTDLIHITIQVQDSKKKLLSGKNFIISEKNP